MQPITEDSLTALESRLANASADEIGPAWEDEVLGLIKEVRRLNGESNRLANLLVENGEKWKKDQIRLFNAAQEIEELKVAIHGHNAGLLSLCYARRKEGDGCQAYVSRGRECPDCPRHDMFSWDALRDTLSKV